MASLKVEKGLLRKENQKLKKALNKKGIELNQNALKRAEKVTRHADGMSVRLCISFQGFRALEKILHAQKALKDMKKKYLT